MRSTRGRPATDPRKRRDRVAAWQILTIVLFWGRSMGVRRGGAVRSVPACQRAGTFYKYARAHARIYFRKVLARWHAGTLPHRYTLPHCSTLSRYDTLLSPFEEEPEGVPATPPNSTIIKISPPLPFRVFFAGRPRVSRGSIASQTCPKMYEY